MAEGQADSPLKRAELWLIAGMVVVLIYFFLKSVDDLVEDVNEFKADQLRESFVSALRAVHMAWIAQGQPSTLADEKVLKQEALKLNKQGWPIGAGAKPGEEESVEQGCLQVFQALLGDWLIGNSMAELSATVSNGQDRDTEPLINPQALGMQVLAVGTVCVYQFGDSKQDRFSLLYNTASGEVRATHHQREDN